MKNIAVFISGGGSDLQSLIDACENCQINGKILTVISNKEDIFGLVRAEKHNIPSKVFCLKNFANSHERDSAIVDYLAPMNIDLIVLAGYLSIVTPTLINAYKNKIINIHPALIPKHCGIGMYGIKVHESVIESRDKYSGATIHYVDEGADTGAIIAQEKILVQKNDTPQSLQEKVLQLEHRLLPKVVASLCN